MNLVLQNIRFIHNVIISYCHFWSNILIYKSFNLKYSTNKDFLLDSLKKSETLSFKIKSS